jgi:hypothetical protein
LTAIFRVGFVLPNSSAQLVARLFSSGELRIFNVFAAEILFGLPVWPSAFVLHSPLLQKNKRNKPIMKNEKVFMILIFKLVFCIHRIRRFDVYSYNPETAFSITMPWNLLSFKSSLISCFVLFCLKIR